MITLSHRERRLITAAAAVVGAGLIWQTVVVPAWSLRTASLNELARVDAVSGLLDRLPKGRTGLPAQDLPPLRQRVTSGAAAAGLEIRRLDPQGTALMVTLDTVSFPKLVGWLDDLTGKWRTRVVSAEISRRPEPGTVSARLVLDSIQ